MIGGETKRCKRESRTGVSRGTAGKDRKSAWEHQQNPIFWLLPRAGKERTGIIIHQNGLDPEFWAARHKSLHRGSRGGKVCKRNAWPGRREGRCAR